MSKLIIVDDEKIILDSLNKYIEKCLPQLEVCGTFYDGEDALQYLLEHPVDIILTDICMPNMDGLELAREICNRMPYCITIIISGYSEFEYARTAIKYNVLNYLLKPLDFMELRKCLEEADALSKTRKHPVLAGPNLQAEAAEVFFIDLLMGLIPSEEILKQRFSQCHFPFSLEESQGDMIRLSIQENDIQDVYYHNIDQYEIILKNMLKLSLPSIPVYFARRNEHHFYYLLFGKNIRQNLDVSSFIYNTHELINISCSVEWHQSFPALKQFIRETPSVSALPKMSPNKAAPNNTAIQNAIRFIEDNYSLELTREMVSDAVFLSPSYFSYQFKQHTGISFFDYLTNVRMQKAIELLSTKMKVGDIAQQVGYQSKNRFFINFRHYTSYTPTEYRRIILSMGETADEG